MDRIATKTRKLNLFGVGKDGFTAGNPNSKIAATQLSARWFNVVQEELANTVEGAGLTLLAGDQTQLSQAIPYWARSTTSWAAPTNNTVFTWASENPKTVPGSSIGLLTDSAYINQDALQYMLLFTPPNKTAGCLTFQVVIAAKTGAPVSNGRTVKRGRVWWTKSATGVVTHDGITLEYTDGAILDNTISMYTSFGQVGLEVALGANGVIPIFAVSARGDMNMYAWL